MATTPTSTRPSMPSGRFMWLSPDRLLYVGLLGEPTVRTMGSVNVYLAHEGRIRVRLDGGDWQSTALAVVPPQVPHQVQSDARLITVLQLEAETVDLAALPAPLRGSGAVHDEGFVTRVAAARQRLAAHPLSLDLGPGLSAPAFDLLFFDQVLPARQLDPRILEVVRHIKRDPASPLSADGCARSVNLSFSRFLHLFRQEVGAPFRSFRTWKRARSLLHHVNRAANLAHVAQDTGYPDSTHFSHSIRQVYGLKPRDIFAGSRRLAIYAQAG